MSGRKSISQSFAAGGGSSSVALKKAGKGRAKYSGNFKLYGATKLNDEQFNAAVDAMNYVEKFFPGIELKKITFGANTEQGVLGSTSYGWADGLNLAGPVDLQIKISNQLDSYPPEVVGTVLVHELTHAAVDTISPGRQHVTDFCNSVVANSLSTSYRNNYVTDYGEMKVSEYVPECVAVAYAQKFGLKHEGQSSKTNVESARKVANQLYKDYNAHPKAIAASKARATTKATAKTSTRKTSSSTSKTSKSTSTTVKKTTTKKPAVKKTVAKK